MSAISRVVGTSSAALFTAVADGEVQIRNIGSYPVWVNVGSAAQVNGGTLIESGGRGIRVTAGQTVYAIALNSTTVVIGTSVFEPLRDPRSVQSFLPSSGGAETYLRDFCTNTITPTAGSYHATRVFLKAGVLTTVEYAKGSTQGATLTNTYFGLHKVSDNSQVAVTADLSTALAAVAASAAGSHAFSISVPADDEYWLGLLIGSAGTMPTFLGANFQGALAALSPKRHVMHTTTGLTAVPATLVPTDSTYKTSYIRVS